MVNKSEENKVFFESLLKSPEFKEEKRIFDAMLGERTIWWLIDRKSKIKSKFLSDINGKKNFCSNIADAEKKSRCLSWLLENLRKASSDIQILRFTCPFKFNGILLPLDYNGEADIFLGICHKKKNIPQLVMDNLTMAVRIISERIAKEQEFNRLSETIRPRAIALSTVHTVHRLIGSTLNLNELLPRIARLSIQVLRAKRCAIMLVNQEEKLIIPKTFIDITRKTPVDLETTRVDLNIEKQVIDTERVYLNKRHICVPLIDQEIIGTIRVEDKEDKKPFNNFDQEILTIMGEQAVIAIKNAQLFEERGQMLLGSIKSLGAILDTRLPNTYTHPLGFVDIVLEIGQELHLSTDGMQSLKYAALLLDAGKIGIPDEILMKPAKLTGKEYSIIKEHPLKGAEIVGSIEAMKPAIPLIMHHHERYDGKGYPMGLAKDKIPIGARIIAVADAFEAMICKRPYKGSMKINDAVEEIKKSSGTQFDPAIVDAFLRLVKKGKISNIVCRLQKGRLKNEQNN